MSEPRLQRNLSTEDARRFWAHAEACAAEVATWPSWKRVGIAIDAPEVETSEKLTVDSDGRTVRRP